MPSLSDLSRASKILWRCGVEGHAPSVVGRCDNRNTPMVKRTGRRERVAGKRHRRPIINDGSERAPFKLGRKKYLRYLSNLFSSLRRQAVVNAEPREAASTLDAESETEHPMIDLEHER